MSAFRTKTEGSCLLAYNAVSSDKSVEVSEEMSPPSLALFVTIPSLMAFEMIEQIGCNEFAFELPYSKINDDLQHIATAKKRKEKKTTESLY
jgi:hypothetical protein